MKKLINISELSKKLKLINTDNQKPMNHIIRYWEREFKQIKPIILNNRRYYNENHISLFKMIKYFLKDKGMTINGVKNIIKSGINTLDENDLYSLKADYKKEKIKNKTKLILDKIKKIKKYGKKDSY